MPKFKNILSKDRAASKKLDLNTDTQVTNVAALAASAAVMNQNKAHSEETRAGQSNLYNISNAFKTTNSKVAAKKPKQPTTPVKSTLGHGSKNGSPAAKMHEPIDLETKKLPSKRHRVSSPKHAVAEKKVADNLPSKGKKIGNNFSTNQVLDGGDEFFATSGALGALKESKTHTAEPPLLTKQEEKISLEGALKSGDVVEEVEKTSPPFTDNEKKAALISADNALIEGLKQSKADEVKVPLLSDHEEKDALISADDALLTGIKQSKADKVKVPLLSDSEEKDAIISADSALLTGIKQSKADKVKAPLLSDNEEKEALISADDALLTGLKQSKADKVKAPLLTKQEEQFSLDAALRSGGIVEQVEKTSPPLTDSEEKVASSSAGFALANSHKHHLQQLAEKKQKQEVPRSVSADPDLRDGAVSEVATKHHKAEPLKANSTAPAAVVGSTHEAVDAKENKVGSKDDKANLPPLVSLAGTSVDKDVKNGVDSAPVRPVVAEQVKPVISVPHTKAAPEHRNVNSSTDPANRVDLGAGLTMNWTEIEDIAQKRLSPMLKDIDVKRKESLEREEAAKKKREEAVLLKKSQSQEKEELKKEKELAKREKEQRKLELKKEKDNLKKEKKSQKVRRRNSFFGKEGLFSFGANRKKDSSQPPKPNDAEKLANANEIDRLASTQKSNISEEHSVDQNAVLAVPEVANPNVVENLAKRNETDRLANSANIQKSNKPEEHSAHQNVILAVPEVHSANHKAALDNLEDHSTNQNAVLAVPEVAKPNDTSKSTESNDIERLANSANIQKANNQEEHSAHQNAILAVPLVHSTDQNVLDKSAVKPGPEVKSAEAKPKQQVKAVEPEARTKPHVKSIESDAKSKPQVKPAEREVKTSSEVKPVEPKPEIQHGKEKSVIPLLESDKSQVTPNRPAISAPFIGGPILGAPPGVPVKELELDPKFILPNANSQLETRPIKIIPDDQIDHHDLRDNDEDNVKQVTPSRELLDEPVQTHSPLENPTDSLKKGGKPKHEQTAVRELLPAKKLDEENLPVSVDKPCPTDMEAPLSTSVGTPFPTPVETPLVKPAEGPKEPLKNEKLNEPLSLEVPNQQGKTEKPKELQDLAEPILESVPATKQPKQDLVDALVQEKQTQKSDGPTHSKTGSQNVSSGPGRSSTLQDLVAQNDMLIQKLDSDSQPSLNDEEDVSSNVTAKENQLDVKSPVQLTSLYKRILATESIHSKGNPSVRSLMSKQGIIADDKSSGQDRVSSTVADAVGGLKPQQAKPEKSPPNETVGSSKKQKRFGKFFSKVLK